MDLAVGSESAIRHTTRTDVESILANNWGLALAQPNARTGPPRQIGSKLQYDMTFMETHTDSCIE
jgi:hypothetical protein